MVSTDGARIILLIFSAQLVNIVCGSSILFLSPLTAPSHSNFFKPAVKALAVRGHFVTYWNGLSQQHSAVLARRSICVYFTRQKWRESNRTLESDFKTDSPFRLFSTSPVDWPSTATPSTKILFHEWYTPRNDTISSSLKTFLSKSCVLLQTCNTVNIMRQMCSEHGGLSETSLLRA